MARAHTVYRCAECGGTAHQWSGRCPTCQAWNTLVEHLEVARAANDPSTHGPTAPARPVTQVDASAGAPVPTTLAEVDRVLGGGLVPGSVTLLGGEPGIGKSTLLLALAVGVARSGGDVLYVAAEESARQVRARAERLGALHDRLWLATETSLEAIVAVVRDLQPTLVVVDSIQAIADTDGAGGPGSVTQVRACAQALVELAKQTDVSVVLVGHVTKDGGLAGPKVLEHVVDTVLGFEGDRHHALRVLRAAKHRFGSTHELGLFEMTTSGLVAVPDPSSLFLTDRAPGLAGSVVVATLDGQRPLLVEVQALTARAVTTPPRRSAQGLDPRRLALLLAVLDNRAGLRTDQHEVYVSAAGGARLTEPGSDLGVCLAVASALHGLHLPHHLVACGEVGLGGELRQAPQTPRRLAEAARLGFRAALVPESAGGDGHGLVVTTVATLVDALAMAGLGGRPSPPSAEFRTMG